LSSIDKTFIEKLVLDVRRSIDIILSYTSKPYDIMSEAERYAVRYHLVVVAEAVVAFALHIARRLYGEEPETPMHAIAILRDRGLIEDNVYKDLVRFMKLRNLLVHRYWIVDDEKIYRDVKDDFRSVRRLIERVEGLCLRQNTSTTG
jgi:uncharacterized protein YutE (UPF0331/DUF86 family)